MQVHNCVYEAYADLTRLSKLHRAPVLSNSSDLYVKDLPYCVINFSTKSFLNLSDDCSQITCKLCRREKLLEAYPGLKLECLPLLKSVHEYPLGYENLISFWALVDKELESKFADCDEDILSILYL